MFLCQQQKCSFKSSSLLYLQVQAASKKVHFFSARCLAKLLGTIDLRRRQIFMIFDPYLPTIGIPAKCLWRGFLMFMYCELLTIGTWGHPSPPKTCWRLKWMVPYVIFQNVIPTKGKYWQFYITFFSNILFSFPIVYPIIINAMRESWIKPYFLLNKKRTFSTLCFGRKQTF